MRSIAISGGNGKCLQDSLYLGFKNEPHGDLAWLEYYFGGNYLCDTGTAARPIISSSLFIASRSRLVSGSERKRLIRRSRMKKASRNPLSTSAAVPRMAAGSGMPQCAVNGCPGQTGQTSFAALSQTVNTKSSLGALGNENSSHALLRSPSVGISAVSS